MLRYLKEVGKHVVTRFCNCHRPGEKNDIIILSSPRSGSTWLMEMLYTQPGMKYINEPLVKNVLDYNKFLPIKTRWNYLELNEAEQDIFKRYFQEDTKIRHFGPRNILDKNYNFFTNRRVIKVIRANALIEWFARELPFEVIYLVRHPIAQSLSCITRGHHCQLSEYLANSTFKEILDRKGIFDFVCEVNRVGKKLEKFVTEWCLDNLIPISKLNENPDWLALTYEEMILNTEQIIDLLYRKLNLEDKNKLLSRAKTPSRTSDSSTKQTRRKIEAGNANYLLSKWKREVTEEQEGELLEILEKFRINVYQPGRLLPHENLLHFSG